MARRAGVPTLPEDGPVLPRQTACVPVMLLGHVARSVDIGCVSMEHGAVCPWNMETGCCGRCEPCGLLLGEEGAPLGQVAQLGD